MDDGRQAHFMQVPKQHESILGINPVKRDGVFMYKTKVSKLILD